MTNRPIDQVAFAGMKCRQLLALISIIASTESGLAQTKYEQEIRIRKIEIPKQAGDFVEGMQLPRKIKWYRETGYRKTSFEAKTKYKGKRLSIEFSGNGILEDLEIETRIKDIPPGAYQKITAYLRGVHRQYTIEKIQMQYSGNPNSIQNYTQHLGADGELVLHYEVVVAAKIEGSFGRFEYLFTQDGGYVKQARIIQKMIDNLVY